MKEWLVLSLYMGGVIWVTIGFPIVTIALVINSIKNK